MAETTLALTYDDLRMEIGYMLGFGRATGSWTATQVTDIDILVQRGVRQFYNPPPVGEDKTGHVWSFLRPVTTLATVAGTGDYTLPVTFGGIDGEFTYAADISRCPITIVGENRIRELRQSTLSNGLPRWAAIRPLTSAGTAAQTFQLMLAPTPDAIYTLSYRYFAVQLKLTATVLYPMGGAAHAETIMESCLAVTEQRLEDGTGLHQRAWMSRLAASVAHDRRLNTPERFGYNADRSDGYGSVDRQRGDVTYNNVLYND